MKKPAFLPHSHYAANWSSSVRPVAEVNKLGLLYAGLADEIPFAPGPVLNSMLINDAGEEVSSEVATIINPEKQRLQLELCQCFHQYLMKYLSMDPNYTVKVKLVVDTINHAFSKQKQFSADEVGRYVEFDCLRYLRLLCRRDFLTPIEADNAV